MQTTRMAKKATAWIQWLTLGGLGDSSRRVEEKGETTGSHAIIFLAVLAVRPTKRVRTRERKKASRCWGGERQHAGRYLDFVRLQKKKKDRAKEKGVGAGTRGRFPTGKRDHRLIQERGGGGRRTVGAASSAFGMHGEGGALTLKKEKRGQHTCPTPTGGGGSFCA